MPSRKFVAFVQRNLALLPIRCLTRPQGRSCGALLTTTTVQHYTTLTQMASASVKIISDTVAKWRARRAIPYETIWVDVEIRGHALPARGRQRKGVTSN